MGLSRMTLEDENDNDVDDVWVLADGCADDFLGRLGKIGSRDSP